MCVSIRFFQFTQRDLNEGRVLFKHLGAKFGVVQLWVSDGKYYVSTSLKIRASEPFIRMANESATASPSKGGGDKVGEMVVMKGDSGECGNSWNMFLKLWLAKQ